MVGWNVVGDTPCSIARTLAVIGDRWTMLIVRDLFVGTRRFDEFQSYTGMSSNLLTQRLNRLVEHGIIRMVPYSRHPPRNEYRLTAKGMDLYPIICGLRQWGDRWSKVDKRLQAKLWHNACGRVMRPLITLRCSKCGEPLGHGDVCVTNRPPPIGHELRATRSLGKQE